jgi:hypothetical protein
MLKFDKLTSNITQLLSKFSKNWLLGISKSVLLYLLIFLVSVIGWIGLANFIPEILPPSYGSRGSQVAKIIIDHTSSGITMNQTRKQILQTGKIILQCTLQGYSGDHKVKIYKKGEGLIWDGLLRYGEEITSNENLSKGKYAFEVIERGRELLRYIEVL